MTPQFLRFAANDEFCEVLVNPTTITKIVSTFGIPAGEPNQFKQIKLAEAHTDPTAIRFYHIYTSTGDVYLANANDSHSGIVKLLDELRKSAIE